MNTLMSDFTKEEKDFLKAFAKKDVIADPNFKHSLKVEVIKEYYKKPSILPKLSFYFGSLAILSLALIFLVNSFSGGIAPSVQTVNTNFSVEEKANVYQNIIKNNPIKVIEASVKSNPTSTNIDPQMDIASIQQNFTQDYFLAEFSTFTQTYSNECSALNVKSGTTFFSEYRDKTKYFSKIISRDLNNNVTRYNLSKLKGQSLEEYLLSEEGTVVRNFSTLNLPKNTQEVNSYPVSYSVRDSSEDIFFEDTILDMQIKKNGKEFYVLKTQSIFDCINPASFPTSYSANSKSKLITLSYFNTVSFELEFSETYLNDINSFNLLYTQTFYKREKQIDISKVEREFEYDLNLTLEEQISLPVSYTL